MSAITVVPGDVRPLTNAVIERYDAGGSIDIGDLVYVVSDGDVEQANGSATPKSWAIGLAVATPGGGTVVASGERVDVCVWGPVTGFSGMTIGNLHYVSDTPGAVDTAVGTKDTIVGYAKTAATLFVRVQIIDLS